MARKIKCWSRKNKQNARYVVCSGSKGQRKLRRSKRLRKKQKGGEVKAFVGESWSSNPASWPGVAGKDGVTNHYALAKNVMPLPKSTSQSGGALKCWSRKNKQDKRYVVCSGSKGQKRRRSKRLRKKQKGGRGLKCWSRKNKQDKRYVVCTGSKGQRKLRRSKRLRKKQKGGQKGAPLAPQVLVNAGRSLVYGGESVYNSVRGVGSPQDPNPTVQPAMTKGVTPSINTDRISDIYSSAEKSVGAI
jgi:hypothetical protein